MDIVSNLPKDKDVISKRFSGVRNSKTFNIILDLFSLGDKKVLDLGCGYGEYLVNFGTDSLGITTTDEEIKYAKNQKINIEKGNAEAIQNLGIVSGEFQYIWANNLIEHLLSPHSFLVNLKNIASDNTTLILGVPVIPKCPFLMRLSKFRGCLAGSHINFFTKESLKLTVERAGWNILDGRSFYFRNRRLDMFLNFLSPHIYIVAKNNLSFKYNDKKLKEWKDDRFYEPIIKTTNKL